MRRTYLIVAAVGIGAGLLLYALAPGAATAGFLAGAFVGALAGACAVLVLSRRKTARLPPPSPTQDRPLKIYVWDPRLNRKVEMLDDDRRN